MSGFRKPVTSELVGGKGNRQRLWEAIRAQGRGVWILRDLCKTAVVHDETAMSYLQGLVAAGYVEVIADVPEARHRGVVRGVRHYRLARDVGAEAPRVTRKGEPVTQGLAQEQMWRTLRMNKGDTNARELAAHATSSAIEVSPVAALDYLRTLDTAGYLTRTAEGARHQDRRWKLRMDRNTGPRPPMVCRTSSVFDPNENRVVWTRDVNEEVAIYGH